MARADRGRLQRRGGVAIEIPPGGIPPGIGPGRAQAGLAPIDWVVVRNRLGAQRMVNKEKMERAVKMRAERVGFRIVPGFSERVVFRELFPRGLTLLDLKDIGVKQLNISNVAARQELRDMMKALRLPGVDVKF